MLFRNFFLQLLLASIYGGGILDNVRSDSAQIHELKDVFHAYAISDVITDQKELIEIHNGKTNIDELIKHDVASCDSMKKLHFYNDTIGKEVNKFISATISNYKALQLYDENSQEFKNAMSVYKDAVNTYWAYIIHNYPLERFANITEEIYQLKNNKANFIRSAKYADYQKMVGKDIKGALKLLDKIISETSNFQEKSIYQIEWADVYVKNGDSIANGTVDASVEAAKRYKVILDKQQYCTFLYEAWLKWRTTDMYTHGSSHDSEVNNLFYNSIRERTAEVVLAYISSHPNDIIAINQFLQLSTFDNVRRFGDYPYGNQNIVIFQQIYDIPHYSK